MKIKEHKKLFKDSFLRTLNEQSLIRNEMIGHRVISIYYSPEVEGWDFDIKDESVIHVPMGFLTIKLSNGHYYQLITNYQSWCGGIFGILIQKLNEDEFINNKYYLDKDYYGENTIWKLLKDSPLKVIKWNWKTEPNELNDGKKMDLQSVSKFLYEDCFVPDNLIFEFDNKEKIHFFALEPDAEIPAKGTYTLISGGEELMVFLDERKLEEWNLLNKGFEIIEK